jgi:hypothetical protein
MNLQRQQPAIPTVAQQPAAMSDNIWCIPRVDAEYAARMEDVLDLYAEAPDPNRPVVCFDESNRLTCMRTQTTRSQIDRKVNFAIRLLREAAELLQTPQTTPTQDPRYPRRPIERDE